MYEITRIYRTRGDYYTTNITFRNETTKKTIKYQIKFNGSAVLYRSDQNRKPEIFAHTLEYDFLKDGSRLNNNTEKMVLLDEILKYRVTKSQKGILSTIELCSRIYLNYTNNDYKCFFAYSPIKDGQLNILKELFVQQNNGLDQNNKHDFFSIIIGSDGEDAHVSTLIVDCKNDELYLFDTSQDTHQISNKTNVNSKIIEINKKIHILNKIKDEPLQSGGCCTIWTSIINSKLAEHNKIEEVINTKTHQLQPEFFRDVVNSVGAFRNKDIKLVDINNCNELFKIITNNNNAEIILENAVQNSYLEKQKNKTQNNKTKQDTNIDTIGHNNDTYYKSEKRLNPVQTPVQNIQHEQDIQPQNIQKTDMQRAQEAAQHMLKNNADIMHTGKNMGANKVFNKQMQTKQNTKTELILNNNIF